MALLRSASYRARSCSAACDSTNSVHLLATAFDPEGVFLDGALERLGLNARERCDMITYWLPQLELSPFNEIFFVHTVRYEQAARLTIFPAPDVTIRIFMAFRCALSFRKTHESVIEFRCF